MLDRDRYTDDGGGTKAVDPSLVKREGLTTPVNFATMTLEEEFRGEGWTRITEPAGGQNEPAPAPMIGMRGEGDADDDQSFGDPGAPDSDSTGPPTPQQDFHQPSTPTTHYGHQRVSPVFTPPTDNTVSPINNYFGETPTDADPAMLRLMAHYRSGPRGRNVFLMADDSVTETQPPNWNPFVSGEGKADPVYAWSYTYAGGVNPPDGVTKFTLAANQRVKRVFWGACGNPITAAESVILTAAGYGPYIV